MFSSRKRRYYPHIYKKRPVKLISTIAICMMTISTVLIYHLYDFLYDIYNFSQYNDVYGFTSLHKKGINGEGHTILIIDKYGSPTIQEDLNRYSEREHIPTIKIQIEKYGTIPTFNKSNKDMLNWAQETSMDIEVAHVVAPKANIILAELSSDNFSMNLMDALETHIDKNDIDVISNSFEMYVNNSISTSTNLSSNFIKLAYTVFNPIYTEATRKKISVLVSSGDDGTYINNQEEYPSTDNNVTSVGGTKMHLDLSNDRIKSDTIWNNRRIKNVGFGISGAGISSIINRPYYQNSIQDITRSNYRSVPDISMLAEGSTFIYNNKKYILGGTSESTPILAGFIALANQKLNTRIGLLNPYLYKLNELNKQGTYTGIMDITEGDNSYKNNKGYKASKYYDIVSGVGTIGNAGAIINNIGHLLNNSSIITPNSNDTNIKTYTNTNISTDTDTDINTDTDTNTYKFIKTNLSSFVGTFITNLSTSTYKELQVLIFHLNKDGILEGVLRDIYIGRTINDDSTDISFEEYDNTLQGDDKDGEGTYELNMINRNIILLADSEVDGGSDDVKFVRINPNDVEKRVCEFEGNCKK